eukprot:GFUD01001579.1.p1 GENE.GFUD01001579.1~~GFUD01001579.1.p1  ORF type:complete len:612 (-),score=140.44 GFUD01001579.1:846-2681(-)
MDPSSGLYSPPSLNSTEELESLPSHVNLSSRPVQSQSYLQALLGNSALPPGQGDDVLPVSLDTSPFSPIVSSTSTVSASGGSMSASLSNPSFASARRNRSVSFSVESSLPLSSPLRTREHASEAGSPTLEQVFLMSRKSSAAGDAGYGSLSVPSFTSQSDLYSSFLPSLSPHQDTSADSPSPPHTRPTLSEMVGIDLAVAQAVQNLQTLQQQQAALYSGLGVAGVPPQVSTPVLDTSQPASDPPGISILNSILASVSQPSHHQPGYKESTDRHPDHAPYPLYSAPTPGPTDPLALERAARLYRSAASVCEASCTWSGQLPPRSSTAGPNSSYSTKIFLGGVPWDISEQTLVQAFSEFGEVRVEWPGRDYTSPPRGYLYLVFQEEGDVTDLLAKCCQDYNTRDSYYYKISSRRMRAKEVQIIPWVLTDSNYVRCPSPRLDPQKTVFVGALHGMMTAQGLAVVFNDLFGGVVYSGLDTDKFKYPIGSGRVTFNNSRSYMKAVAAAFIEIKTPRFCKKVQVDPYLEDTLCSMCGMKQGPYFCRDLSCFNYFCHGCWDLHHTCRPNHKPLMRNIRGLTRARTNHHNHHDYNVGRFRQDPVRDLAEQFGQTFGLQG